MGDFPTLRGTVRGKTIELDHDAGLPDGQLVSVIVQPLPRKMSEGEGLRLSFGCWSDDTAELDEYLDWSRQQRKNGRLGMEM